MDLKSREFFVALFLYKNQTFAVISVDVTRLLHEKFETKTWINSGFLLF